MSGPQVQPAKILCLGGTHDDRIALRERCGDDVEVVVLEVVVVSAGVVHVRANVAAATARASRTGATSCTRKIEAPCRTASAIDA